MGPRWKVGRCHVASRCPDNQKLENLLHSFLAACLARLCDDGGMMGQETLSVIVNLCGKKPVVGFCPSTAGSHVDPLGARQQQQ